MSNHVKSIFYQKVYEIVSKIPRGKVLTYEEVAKKAGSPKASRAVVNILSRNIDKNVPCHRVIKSDGTSGGYNELQGKDKLEILRKEGIKI